MPSPKSGSPGSLVEPVDPDVALDADDASPGQMEELKQHQKQTGTGKYGQQQAKPFKAPEDPKTDPTPSNPSGGGGGTTPDDPTQKKVWIEILLVDANDKPVAGEPYRITMPDNSVKDGTLDSNGFARVNGIDPGTCKVTFPQLDGRSWKKA